jgi:hypothetical protein
MVNALLLADAITQQQGFGISCLVVVVLVSSKTIVLSCDWNADSGNKAQEKSASAYISPYNNGLIDDDKHLIAICTDEMSCPV